MTDREIAELIPTMMGHSHYIGNLKLLPGEGLMCYTCSQSYNLARRVRDIIAANELDRHSYQRYTPCYACGDLDGCHQAS